MRQITNHHYSSGIVTAVCDDGSFWIGVVRNVADEGSDEEDLIVEWKPLNSPPDGDPFVDKRSRWDKLEEKIRNEADD